MALGRDEALLSKNSQVGLRIHRKIWKLSMFCGRRNRMKRTGSWRSGSIRRQSRRPEVATRVAAGWRWRNVSGRVGRMNFGMCSAAGSWSGGRWGGVALEARARSALPSFARCSSWMRAWSQECTALRISFQQHGGQVLLELLLVFQAWAHD